MTSIVVPGPLGSDKHLREDGEPWPFALVLDEDSTVFADDAGEIIGHLIPGYADLPGGPEGDDRALITRWQTAVVTASDVQSAICADRTAEGRFSPDQETEEVLTALFRDKTVPVEDFKDWTHSEVPIVLITTDYEPYTERTPLGGNVLWIDPSDEVAFLRSLANLGVIAEFYVHDDA